MRTDHVSWRGVPVRDAELRELTAQTCSSELKVNDGTYRSQTIDCNKHNSSSSSGSEQAVYSLV
jgi:hypothetical protein